MHHKILFLPAIVSLFISVVSSSSSDPGSNTDSKHNIIKTIEVSGLSSTAKINDPNIFNLDLSGSGHVVTIVSGNQVDDINIKGLNNLIKIETNVTVNHIYVTGSGNTVIVPVGSGIGLSSNSGLNNRIIEQ
jgi:hypothetical protein